MMRTANPALNANTFKRYDQVARAEGAMTINGTVHKTAILVLLAFISASYVWKLAFAQGPGAVSGLIPFEMKGYKRWLKTHGGVVQASGNLVLWRT